MKKSFVFILAIIMSCLLIACEKENQNSGSFPQTNNEKTKNTKKYIENKIAIIIHISINPSFEIYVDENGIVENVVCLNEDAKTIIEQITISEKTCEDVAYQILNETVRQGVLKSNDKIEITIYFSEEAAVQMNDWMQKVETSIIHVLEEHNIGAQLVFASELIESNKSNTEYPIIAKDPVMDDEDFREENSFTEQEVSESMEEIIPETMVEEIDTEGNKIVRDENGSIVHVVDKTGKLLQFKEPDGTETKIYYDENGKESFREIFHIVGVVEIQRYDINGHLMSNEVKQPDGTQEINKYDESGNLVSYDRIMLDQSYSYTYYGNGVVASEIEKQQMGFCRERYYYEDGVLSREYQEWEDGSYKDEYYDQNGNPTQANVKHAGIGVEERTYRQDGTSYGYWYDINGPVFYYEFDVNGRQLLDTHKQVK